MVFKVGFRSSKVDIFSFKVDFFLVSNMFFSSLITFWFPTLNH